MFTIRYNVEQGSSKDGILDYSTISSVASGVGPAEAVSARRTAENVFCKKNGGYFKLLINSDQDALWVHCGADGERTGEEIYVSREVDSQF